MRKEKFERYVNPKARKSTKKLLKVITINEAITIAEEILGEKISKQTMVMWVGKNKLGHQPSGKFGKWFVFKDRLIDHLRGE